MRKGFWKQLSIENKFDRKYACWVKNNPKAWAWNKSKNRKSCRRKLKEYLQHEIIDIL